MALSKVVSNSIESMDAGKLTGTLPAISGANLTNMAGGGFTLLAEQATTSGTSVTFSSIPSGTTMIVVMAMFVSMTGGDDLVIQLGDSGGIETGDYRSAGVRNSSFSTNAKVRNDGFWFGGDQSAGEIFGSYILTLVNASTNEWVGQCGGGHYNASDVGFAGGGVKTLSGVLTQLKLRPVQSNTFDNGSVSLMYL